MIAELAERSGGMWRPSPGSVYPVLQQLDDEGLVTSEGSGSRRVYSLTDAGRAYVAEHAEELSEPWRVAEPGPQKRFRTLMEALTGLGMAVHQVARLGEDEQVDSARRILDDARREMYRILAGDAREDDA